MIKTNKYMGVRDLHDGDQLLYWLSTFRSHDDHAPRLGAQRPDGLRIIAYSSHTLNPRVQQRYSIRAKAALELTETASCMHWSSILQAERLH
jgi:hypothetical protein